MAGKTEVFEAWECDWMCGLHELKEEPTTDGHKLVLRVPVRCEDETVTVNLRINFNRIIS